MANGIGTGTPAGNVGFGSGAGPNSGAITNILPLLAQMAAALGGNLDPQGPAGTMGNMANQWIQNQSYMNMMKNQLGNKALADMSLADTAGLTPEHMSNIMKTMLEQRGLSQRSLSDAYDAAYKMSMMKTQQGQLGVQREGLGIRRGELDVKRGRLDLEFRKLSKPEQTALTTEFELQKSQGGYDKFNDWYAWRRTQDKSEAAPKTPGLVSYGQAKASLSNRFGSKSADGQFFITPGLESASAYATDRFTGYSRQGFSPGESEVMAYKDAQGMRRSDSAFNRLADALEKAGRGDEIQARANAFRKAYGHFPTGYR